MLGNDKGCLDTGGIAFYEVKASVKWKRKGVRPLRFGWTAY
jgi:hypothetical protein